MFPSLCVCRVGAGRQGPYLDFPPSAEVRFFPSDIELNESFQTHSTLASVEITCEIHTHEKKLAVAVASFGSTESVAPACGCVFRSNVNVSLVVLFFAATNVR